MLSPDIESDLTFGDLWRALDWSGVEDEAERWVAENPSEHETNDESKRKLRVVFVEQALWGEDGERKQEARGLLHAAGIWIQIIAFYKLNGLIIEGEIRDDDTKRDTPDGAPQSQEGPPTT